MTTEMYYLPEKPSGTPTVEDLKQAVDITEALVVDEEFSYPEIPLAPRAERRACAKQGHQRKGNWSQCANCGAAL